jgi:hypothetical protein
MHGGIEWLADGHDGSPARLRVRSAACGELALHAVETAEIHLTIHTFPESGVATLIGELLGARELRVTEHARGSTP